MKIKKCFPAKIAQQASMLRAYLCTMLDFSRLFKGYSSKSGSKPSAFFGPQTKPVNLVVTVFQRWLPCFGEFMEYGKQYGSEESIWTGIQIMISSKEWLT